MGAAAPFIAIGATVLSTAMGAYGAIQQGQQQAAQANYQAKVAMNNQAIAQANARNEQTAGAEREKAEGMKTRALVGEQQAQQASSGLDVNSGSSVAVRSSASVLGMENTGNIRDEASRRVNNYKVQGVQYGNDAAGYKAQAAQAEAAIPLNVASTLIGGAASVGGQYADFQRTGAFNPGISLEGAGGGSYGPSSSGYGSGYRRSY